MARVVDGIPQHIAERRNRAAWSSEDIKRLRSSAAEAGVSRRELAKLILKYETVKDVVAALGGDD